jgi:leader peptidase (prepilin peptidase)/N-methyltransferase
MPSLLRGCAFLLLLLVASAEDIRSRTIPNQISLLILATGLIQFDPVRLWGLLLGLPFLISAAICNGGIGGGDIKLAAAAGFVLGFPTGVLGVIIGLSLLLVYHLSHKTSEKSYPLAPFLSAGFVAAFLIG